MALGQVWQQCERLTVNELEKTGWIRSNTTRENYAKVVAHRTMFVACLSVQQICHKTCCPMHIGIVLPEADLKERRRNMFYLLEKKQGMSTRLTIQ